jgi:hypothetical protein
MRLSYLARELAPRGRAELQDQAGTVLGVAY